MGGCSVGGASMWVAPLDSTTPKTVVSHFKNPMGMLVSEMDQRKISILKKSYLKGFPTVMGGCSVGGASMWVAPLDSTTPKTVVGHLNAWVFASNCSVECLPETSRRSPEANTVKNTMYIVADTLFIFTLSNKWIYNNYYKVGKFHYSTVCDIYKFRQPGRQKRGTWILNFVTKQKLQSDGRI